MFLIPDSVCPVHLYVRISCDPHYHCSSRRSFIRTRPANLFLALQWEEILQKIVSNEFDPTFLINRRIRLEDFPDFYPILASRMPGVHLFFGVTKFRFVTPGLRIQQRD